MVFKLLEFTTGASILAIKFPVFSLRIVSATLLFNETKRRWVLGS